jgi:TetR/AcrR family transcriptional repressor of nem operon
VPYPEDHKPRVHRHIVDTAARLFRERGYKNVSIDLLMDRAGLTRGGFYSHFKHKGQLLREALHMAFEQSRENLFGKGTESLRGRAWQRSAVERYLTLSHRDGAANGCPIPALASEVSRGPSSVRQSFEAEVQDIVSDMAARLGGTRARQRAIALLAQTAGALLLARAVRSERFAREILDAVRAEAGGRPIRGPEQSRLQGE